MSLGHNGSAIDVVSRFSAALTDGNNETSKNAKMISIDSVFSLF